MTWSTNPLTGSESDLRTDRFVKTAASGFGWQSHLEDPSD